MRYQLRFQVYQRPFKTPLHTHHGLWSVREGIILSFTDPQGHITYGEIAPLPWFGTETLDQAIALCAVFGDEITPEQIAMIPDAYPACQFGFATGVYSEQLSVNSDQFSPQSYCQLLSRSDEVFAQLDKFIQAGFRTFKVKIAVTDLSAEMDFCDAILDRLPPSCQLRLDANGGLTVAEAQQWLTWGDRQTQLEFIEQPLPPAQLAQLLTLQAQFKTTLALDESVTHRHDLQRCYAEGWRGVFVIKAAIAGYPSRLIKFCHGKNLDLVFSTAFETEIGQRAVLHLAQQLANPQRALGMGGSHWF